MKKFIAILLFLFLSLSSFVVNADEATDNLDTTTISSVDNEDTTTASSDDMEDSEEDDMNDTEETEETESEDIEGTDEEMEDDNKPLKRKFEDRPNVKPMPSMTGALNSDMMNASREEMKKKMEERKNMIMEKRDQIKTNTEEKRTYVKSQIDMKKKNIEAFRMENKEDIKSTMMNLDDSVKESIKEIHETYKSTMDSLQTKLKQKGLTIEERDAIRKEIEEARKAMYESLKEVVGEDEMAGSLLEERKMVFETNKAIREQMSEKRVEFREQKASIIADYKNKFIDRIGAIIEKANLKQLEKLNDSITKMIENIEANTKMEEEAKNTMLSKLEALRDIVVDKLDNTDNEEMLDLESILTDVE